MRFQLQINYNLFWCFFYTKNIGWNQYLVWVQFIQILELIIQPLGVQSEIQQTYIDKQPSLLDQTALANQQKALLQTQCLKFASALTSQMNFPNLMYQSILQNLLLSSQYVFKSIIDLKPQGQIKQEFDSHTQLQQQYSYTQQPYQQRFYPLSFTQIRT